MAELDETKESTQDETQKETPSGEAEGTTSGEPQTFTKEDVQKAVNDALSAAGRDAKTISEKATQAEQILADAKKSQDEIKAQRKQWIQEREEAEREAVKDDPEALKSLEERQRQRGEADKLSKERDDLEAEKKAHQEQTKADLEQVKVFKRTQLAAEVAVEKGVDVDAILKLAKEDTREEMESIAELLPKKEGKDKPPLKTYSGDTAGGQKPLDQKLKERYPSMY